MKKILICMSAALLLTGCGLYNKYERPEVNAEGLVRDPLSITDTLAVQDTTSFGYMPWRSVFTDPQLQALIQQGLDNNPDLLNAALNVKIVETALTCAKLAFLPSLTVSPQGTLSSFDGAAATKSYTLPISASWNVDLFGNLLSQKRGAQMQLIATKDYQTVVKCNIISNVANLYYTLLMLDRQVQIISDMEQLTKETWDKMKFMHENRVGYRSTAVQSAEASHYSVLAQKVDLLRQIREMENSLSLLVGQQGQAIARGQFDQHGNQHHAGKQERLERAGVHGASSRGASCRTASRRKRISPRLAAGMNRPLKYSSPENSESTDWMSPRLPMWSPDGMFRSKPDVCKTSPSV